MDDVVAMTVPPPLPTKNKNQTRDLNQARHVSIRTLSPPSLPLPSEAGATVFVGASAPAACRRIPEMQSANGHWQNNVEHPCNHPAHSAQHPAHPAQHTAQRHAYPAQQQAAHVVKIRINPSDETGKVISTVRLNLEKNSGSEIQKGVVVVCATNDIVKNSSASVESDCVRINVNCQNGINSEKDIRRKNINSENESLHQQKDDMVLDRTFGNGNDINSENDINSKNDINSENRSLHQQKDDMVLERTFGNDTSCFYYGSFQSSLTNMVISSGQCSPSDTLDSGTCSDLDGTPPPLPKKNSSMVLLGGSENHGAATQHNRTGSLTSSGAEVESDDNDDNDDESNISCDSLNSRELVRVNGSPSRENGAFQVLDLKNYDSKDTQERKGEVRASTKLEILVNDNDNNGYLGPLLNSSRVFPISPSPSGTSSSKASSTPRVRSPSLMVKECTYEERKQEQERFEKEFAEANYYANYNRVLGAKYVYDDDRFYKFHLNERFCDEENISESKMNGKQESENKENDEFAGYKILEREPICSAKGTVRGVKNRVRAGIATFLQKPSTKNYKTKDAGKVVVYTTTMGIVRETYYACMKVKQILRTHMVKYEERDMFMSTESQTELRDRTGSTTIQVPQLFIDGQYIGDADTVERLNETGELRIMLKPYKSADACSTCKICGGYRLLPCPVCNGSKKSVHRNDFTTEFVALKCMNCDEVGLVRCQHC